MSHAEIIIADIAALLLLGTLVGSVVRARLHLCWPFTAYLFAALIMNRLVTWWPGRFFTRQFWLAQELLLAGLESLIAIALCMRALRSFPRVRRMAIAAVAAAISLAVLLVTLAPDAVLAAQARQLVARAHIGAAWSMTAILLFTWRYSLPLLPFERMLLVGFTLHLTIYGALLSLAGAWSGTPAYGYLRALDPAVFTATLGVWLSAAWQPANREPARVEAAAHT